MPRKSDRATRYPFAANIELTDVQSERVLNARTSNLSVFGCYVSTTNPFPAGTKVSIRMTHGGATFTAMGKVVYASAYSGMGVFFIQVEAVAQAILEKWIASLRTK